MNTISVPFYNIQSIGQNIFLLTEKSPLYKIADLFIRYQEFYECPNPEFRGKIFSMNDYINWYQQAKHEDMFTYQYDFVGFNIPGSIIANVANTGIPDRNKFDLIMHHIYNQLKFICHGEFYLIGYTKGWEKTLQHEIAHALYYLDIQYRNEMQECLKQLTSEQRITISNQLLSHLYCESVLDDELQAYLSEDNNWLGRLRIPGLKERRREFNRVYKKYTQDLLQNHQNIAA